MSGNTVQVYDEFAVKHEAAYAAFRRIHESKNPQPIMDTVERDIVSLIIVIALTIVSVASIIVSSSRTVEEFGGGTIGATAFVMIEGGIMAYAFFRARRTASKERLQRTVAWATAGLILTFIVGLGANVDATLRHKGIDIPSEVNLFINLLVAISAPSLAFISSDVLSIELMATEIKRREARLKYIAEMKEWQDGLNRSWNTQQAKWGVVFQPADDGRADADKPLLSALSAADGQRTDSGHGYGVGYQRTTDARTRVTAYLAENPEAISMNVRELAALIGVGKTTVSDVMREVKAGNLSARPNSEQE